MTANLVQADYTILQEAAARFGRESLLTTELMHRLEQLAQSLPAGHAQPPIAEELLPALHRLAAALAKSQAASQQIITIFQQAEQTAVHPPPPQ
jgi:hypothetical protein